jgi:hypothetical protein
MGLLRSPLAYIRLAHEGNSQNRIKARLNHASDEFAPTIIYYGLIAPPRFQRPKKRRKRRSPAAGPVDGTALKCRKRSTMIAVNASRRKE